LGAAAVATYKRCFVATVAQSHARFIWLGFNFSICELMWIKGWCGGGSRSHNLLLTLNFSCCPTNSRVVSMKWVIRYFSKNYNVDSKINNITLFREISRTLTLLNYRILNPTLFTSRPTLQRDEFCVICLLVCLPAFPLDCNLLSF